jgi:formylmethanofuran dehydrogenase subunit E
MNDFYNKVEKIKLYDPLSEFLGSFERGIVEIDYESIVKTAGHSCPTVAGAYLMTLVALKALYTDTLPVRGGIEVSFKESMEEGVAGVIANVISNITGATDKSGFKGLNGKFARHSLMHFNADIKSNAKFTRVDTKQSIEIIYNPNVVPASAQMQPLMQKMMQGKATDAEKLSFGKLWQERVEKIVCNYEDYPELITVA